MAGEATEPGTAGRRWYLAWHPAAQRGVVRSKDADGLAEWRARDWRMFPDRPDIVDVTEAVGQLFADIARPGADPLRSRVPMPWRVVATRAVDGGPIRLAVRARTEVTLRT